MAEILLEADHVGLAYHELDGETLAVEDISFAVEKGEFLSIVGPSGCGKTSILSMIDGLMQPSRGRINLYGKSRPGYMLQRDHLLDWRTVEGNVLLGLQVKGMLNEETRAFTNSLLKTYGLSDFAKSYPRQLSGGMRQKVALIRTLACSPELLLLDEPFSALDYQTRLTVSDEIYGIIRKEGKTGRVYYPAPFMTNENLALYQDAYEIGPEKIIDTYAEATKHVDQGLSLTLFFPDTATTRDINRAQIYAWKKGIKTLYYIRLRQLALEGTEIEGCVSCAL